MRHLFLSIPTQLQVPSTMTGLLCQMSGNKFSCDDQYLNPYQHGDLQLDRHETCFNLKNNFVKM